RTLPKARISHSALLGGVPVGRPPCGPVVRRLDGVPVVRRARRLASWWRSWQRLAEGAAVFAGALPGVVRMTRFGTGFSDVAAAKVSSPRVSPEVARRRTGAPAEPHADRAPLRRPPARRGRAGPREDACDQGAELQHRGRLSSAAVHAGSAAGGPDRHGNLSSAG